MENLRAVLIGAGLELRDVVQVRSYGGRQMLVSEGIVGEAK